MKTLFVLALVICSQTVTAACPKKEMLELAYMTKEDLMREYCSNDYDYNAYKKAADTWDKAREHMQCSESNMRNAFNVLRKDHGIGYEENIKCNERGSPIFTGE